METEAPVLVQIFFVFVWFAGLVTHPGRSIIVMSILGYGVISGSAEPVSMSFFLGACGLVTLVVCMFTTWTGLGCTFVGYHAGRGTFGKLWDKIFD